MSVDVLHALYTSLVAPITPELAGVTHVMEISVLAPALARQGASEATVPLTTVMLKEYEAHPKRGKAQAQRKAILALMNTVGRPEYAHPLYWAPFVVVGEGGAGARAK